MPNVARFDALAPPDLPAVREIAAAWERFVAGGPIIGAAVESPIVDSWRRSLASGVAPTGGRAPIAAVGDAFQHLRTEHSELIHAASALMQSTGASVRAARSIMVLTDARGVVLEAIGHESTLDAGQDINLMPGGHWGEDVIGTNGIGTAIAMRAPVQIHATEHFCAGIKAWTCAGAPIWNPAGGQLLGVLDISGPPDTFQRNNLALAVAGARQIEIALTAHSMLGRNRLLEACLQRVGRLDASCVVVLDVHGVIAQVVGSAPSPDVRAGRVLPGLDARLPLERWAEQLPAPWRAEGFELVRLGQAAVGALLVLPYARRASSARSAEARTEYDARRSGFAGILGASASLRSTIERARQLATKRVAVLIQGETGCGKELFARAIHGDEEGGPFVIFNCGATTKELVGAELFGHVRGAYTGATAEGRPGRFELAHGGTLCLDEIGELPLELQPVLLRTLEEGVVYRLGDTHPRRFDVRLLSMTHRDLLADIEAGRFRRDLYHRLGVARLHVPPLRERGGDVELLVEHYNRRLAARHGMAPRRYGPEVLSVFDAYGWPGNVRELRNVIETLLLTAGELAEVSIDELPEEILAGVAVSLPEPANGRADGVASLQESEREAIERAVRQHRGNLVQAARALGIARSTLYRKVERYRLERDPAAKSDI